jgi:hypothetical protein
LALADMSMAFLCIPSSFISQSIQWVFFLIILVKRVGQENLKSKENVKTKTENLASLKLKV